jgi:hypothetical protein
MIKSIFSKLFQSSKKRVVNRSKGLIELSKIFLTYFFIEKITDKHANFSKQEVTRKSIFWVNEIFGYEPSELHKNFNKEIEFYELLEMMESFYGDINFIIVNGIRIKYISDSISLGNVEWTNDFFSKRILEEVGKDFPDSSNLDVFNMKLLLSINQDLNSEHKDIVSNWIKSGPWKDFL